MAVSYSLSLELGIARALVSRYGLMPDEAEVLVSKHRTLIVDETIYHNAERIVAAEVASLPTPPLETIEAATPTDEPEAPQVKSKSMTELLELSLDMALSRKSKSKAQQHLKPFIRLGDQLVPLHSDKEVKQMKREGYEIVMQ